MYIRSLHLANLRCFKKADVTFQYPGRVPRDGEPPVATLPNVTLLLGNNGAGKSTILQGVALALIAPVLPHTGFRPQSLVRRTFGGARGPVPQKTLINAVVEVTAADLEPTPKELKERPQARNGKAGEYPLELGIKRIRDTEVVDKYPRDEQPWQRMFEERTPGFLVVGYGANRWVAPKNVNVLVQFRENHIRYQRIRSLFEDGTALVPLSQWLPDYANKGRRKQVITLLDKFLQPHGYAFEGESENGELIFTHGRSRVPYPALSHGFRAFIGWVGDLLYHVCEWCPSGRKLRDIEGVVIVDEVDLFLHPEWQRTIIASLAKSFRKVQFIFSSHSPLVTGSMEWANIWVMRESGPVQLPDEPIHGLSADQVLLSPYFGLTSTRSEEKMQKLYTLNARAVGGDAAAANDFLRELSTGMEASGVPVAPTPTLEALEAPFVPAARDSWNDTVKSLPPPLPSKAKAKSPH